MPTMEISLDISSRKEINARNSVHTEILKGKKHGHQDKKVPLSQVADLPDNTNQRSGSYYCHGHYCSTFLELATRERDADFGQCNSL